MLTERTEPMQDFVEQVRERAGLGNAEEADQLSRASVQALGQAISGGQAGQLAQWLPDELSAELSAQGGQASAFDKAQFLDKVGGKIFAVDSDRVEQQISAVLSTIRSTASGAELEDTLAQLPPQLQTLFAVGGGASHDH